jgi:outer membrane protein assembly factor BamB
MDNHRVPINSRLARLTLPAALLLGFLAACQQAGQPPSMVSVDPFDGGALHQAWSYSFGGPLNHAPLRVGDILVAAPAEAPLAGLRAETGELAWEFDPGVRIWDRAYASDGERIYVGIEGGRLVALAPDRGETLWQADLGINTQIPPLPLNGVVYVSTTFVGTALTGNPSGKAVLFALDAANGDVLWEFESGNYILQTAFLFKETIYVAGSYDDPAEVDEGGHMRLYALNASDGSVRWSYESTDGYPKQLYATAYAVAYVAYQDFAVGVDAENGELLWRRDTGNWVPTLSGSGDIIYYGSANTVVHAVNTFSGEAVWQYNIPEGTFNYVIGAPVPTGNELIFLTQQGDVAGLNRQTGELIWSLQTGITGARAGLSVFGNWIYIGDAEGTVYGFTDR